MIYRFLGNTGMKVSVIGLGNMVFDKVTNDNEDRYLKEFRAFESGVNYFDTSEGYGNGNAEIVLGKCLKKAGRQRKDYVLSTKLFSSRPKPNDGYLSRKHIIEGAIASSSRLQLEYVDIIFAHILLVNSLFINTIH